MLTAFKTIRCSHLLWVYMTNRILSNFSETPLIFFLLKLILRYTEPLPDIYQWLWTKYWCWLVNAELPWQGQLWLINRPYLFHVILIVNLELNFKYFIQIRVN